MSIPYNAKERFANSGKRFFFYFACQVSPVLVFCCQMRMVLVILVFSRKLRISTSLIVKQIKLTLTGKRGNHSIKSKFHTGNQHFRERISRRCHLSDVSESVCGTHSARFDTCKILRKYKKLCNYNDKKECIYINKTKRAY